MKSKPASRKTRMPKTWLITGLLAAGAVAYVVFIFLPSQRTIDALRAQVQERNQQIMQAQSLTGTLAQARLRLASAQAVSREWRETARQAHSADERHDVPFSFVTLVRAR